MGAPIVVNTVKVQGTVTSNAGSGTTAVVGTVSQSGTWNVNAIQSGTWNVGGTVSSSISNGSANAVFVQGTATVVNTDLIPLYVHGTAHAIQSGGWNVGGTVSAQQYSTWFVGGTITSTNTAGTPLYVTGTTTVTNGSAGAIFTQGTTTITNAAAGAIYTQGTVTSNVGSGTMPVSNINASALFMQGTVTIPAAAPAYVAGTTTVTNAAAGAIYVQGTASIAGTASTVERGATIAQGSATIGTAMGTVLTSSATRRTILIQNLGTDYVWIGGSTAIVVNTGARLAPGQAITIDKSPISAIYAVASSGSQTVCYFTESD
jgi:hypothetical protein